ncbi:hypothetical protein CASFOL_017541 [Castilleja foliolosa]|uniref:Uncharacterized protein n=1 Tax=Castilleja foliolosa TaxID=1961234 RepID=A0ABD3DEP9_9LAMI
MGRVSSTVSKSVSVLDHSGKDNSSSAKPPRRLSVPNKSNATPAPKPVGNVTPISKARAKTSAVNQGKSVTPVSDVSKSLSTRKKFSILYSASYWLSQIKHSESAAKHSISLGFFKLALEAGCEPIQRMSDELKSYARRHHLTELGEFVKELFEGYKISENFEPSQSESGSQVRSESNQLSDDDVKSSSSSITDTENLKPISLDLNAGETEKVEKANNKISEKDDSVKKSVKRSVPKRAASSKSGNGSEIKGRSVQKKPQKPTKQESAQGKDKIKKVKNSASEEGLTKSYPPEETLEENKENMVTSEMPEVGSTEA